MGTCNIDHSREDVLKKLENQDSFLPANLVKELQRFLTAEQSQKTLNELFHLFKKYDLASKEEQEDRNKQLQELIS